MSATEGYGPPRFGPGPRGESEGAVYGPVDASEFTKIICPVCHRMLLIPRGHIDTTHDCSVLCPYCNWTTLPIPGDPSQAVVPLLIKSADQLVPGGWQGYFRYCPNPACPYLASNLVAYLTKRVEVDILVGR